MARPKKDPEHTRTEQVNVRVSPSELRRIASKADGAGLSVTAFVRDAALGKRVTIKESTAPDFETRQELQRIGNNLNQIARSLNARPYLSPPLHLNELTRSLETLFERWLLSDGPEDRQDRP